MKIVALTTLCLIGTVSTVFGSPCEDDHPREKRSRSEMTASAEKESPSVAAQRQRTMASSSLSSSSSSSSLSSSSSPSSSAVEAPAASFGDALSRLLTVPSTTHENHLTVQYRARLMRDVERAKSLQHLASAALWKTCALHAQQGNLAPIMFLADTAKAYPFLGTPAVAYQAAPNQIVPDSFLSNCPAVDLTEYGSENIIPVAKIITSPHIQSMRINMHDVHKLFSEITYQRPLPGLTSLRLDWGDSDDLWVLEGLPRLRHLVLYNTDLSTPISPDYFQRVTCLERLEIHPCFISEDEHFLHGDLVETLATLPCLRKIKFNLCQEAYTALMPTNLGKLSSLTHFAYKGVRDNQEWGFLKTLAKVRSLNIRGCDIASLEPLWHLPHLTSIKATHTEVDPATVAGLKHVRYLRLNECSGWHQKPFKIKPWEPNDLAYFGGLTSLRALDLRETFSYHPIETREQVAVLARLNLLYLGLTDRDIAESARAYFDELGVRYSPDDMPKTVKRAIKHMDAQDDAPAA